MILCPLAIPTMVKMLSCRHRLSHDKESRCWLSTNYIQSDGTRSLVFHDGDNDRAILCDSRMAKICPYREEGQVHKGSMVPCEYCGRKHKDGSNSQMICQAWSIAKDQLKLLRARLPEGHRYYDQGTTVLPYPEGTTPLVRRLVWQKMRTAVLRRDRYRCQECKVDFGGRRKKRLHPDLRHGKGGYRWDSLEVHHIIPRAAGGSDHPGNLITLCPECHAKHTREQISSMSIDRKEKGKLLKRLRETGFDDDITEDPRD